MSRSLLAAVLLVGAAAFLPAQEGRPKGPPPTVMVAHPDGVGGAYLQHVRTEYDQVKQIYQVKVGDRIEQREATVMVPVQRVVRVALGSKEVRLFNGRGKPVEPRDIPRYITGVTPVLVSADGNEIDPFYLRMARPGALIVVARDLVGPPTAPVPKKMPGSDPEPKKQ